MSEDRKVHDAEIVGREDSSSEPDEPRLVERVRVTRIPGGSFFARSVHSDGDAEDIKRSVKRLQFRMWVWFVAFALATIACFYVAYVSEWFIVQVLLILLGGLTGLVTGFLFFVVWGLRRIRLP